MADCDLPSPTELRQLLRYEAETGKLFWLPRDTGTRGGRYFNTRYAGKEALTGPTKGYLAGSIRDKPAKAHRVAWAIHFGEWPNGMIDHINQDRADNRITNLRVVGHIENGRNAKRHRTNTSGVTGVGWVKNKCRWRAMIKVGGHNHYIGMFLNFEDAVEARRAAEAEYGFHENHGRT